MEFNNFKLVPARKRTCKVQRSSDSQRRFGHRKVTTSKNKEKDTPIKHGYHLEDYERKVVYEHYYSNEEKPFYVGCGTLQRAFVLKGNRRHINYNKKAEDINLIKVKIVAIDISDEDALKLEKELTLKYGRESEGGSLVNIDINTGGHRDFTNNRKIYKFDLNGNFIEEYNSIQEAAKKNNCRASSITLCARGVKGYKRIGGFMWRYNKEFTNFVSNKLNNAIASNNFKFK